MPGRMILALLLAIYSTGCGRARPVEMTADQLTDQEFIEVFVELRNAATESESDSDFKERRDQILERHQLEGEDLLEFIELRSSDLVRMEEVWDSIYQRFKAQAAEARS